MYDVSVQATPYTCQAQKCALQHSLPQQTLDCNLHLQRTLPSCYMLHVRQNKAPPLYTTNSPNSSDCCATQLCK
jgi:hypothetical protein